MGIAIKQKTMITIEAFREMLMKHAGIIVGTDVRLKIRTSGDEQLLEAEWTAPERVERDG